MGFQLSTEDLLSSKETMTEVVNAIQLTQSKTNSRLQDGIIKAEKRLATKKNSRREIENSPRSDKAERS